MNHTCWKTKNRGNLKSVAVFWMFRWKSAGSAPVEGVLRSSKWFCILRWKQASWLGSPDIENAGADRSEGR